MHPYWPMVRILVGFALMFIAFDGAGRLLEGFGLVVGKLGTAAVGLAAAVAIELLLYGRRSLAAVLASLGWGRPNGRVLVLSVVVSATLLVCLPLVFRLGGSDLVLPDDWPLLALGILLVNGLAEETIFRGFLFRGVRQGRTFGRAVVLGTVLAAAAHVPIVFSVGPLVGGVAILVAVLTFLPFATLYERGGNTIWPSAVLHFAADCILPLGALGLATPVVIVWWMGAQVAACYLALILVRSSVLRDSLAMQGVVGGAHS